MLGKRHAEAVQTFPPVRPFMPVDEAVATQEVSVMFQPTDSELTRTSAVRGGHGAPVTCAACGCRLSQTGETWFHFNPLGGRDARGCRIACADAAHDASGRPVSLAV